MCENWVDIQAFLLEKLQQERVPLVGTGSWTARVPHSASDQTKAGAMDVRIEVKRQNMGTRGDQEKSPTLLAQSREA
jgi:hypothetical protein